MLFYLKSGNDLLKRRKEIAVFAPYYLKHIKKRCAKRRFARTVIACALPFAQALLANENSG